MLPETGANGGPPLLVGGDAELVVGPRSAGGGATNDWLALSGAGVAALLLATLGAWRLRRARARRA